MGVKQILLVLYRKGYSMRRTIIIGILYLVNFYVTAQNSAIDSIEVQIGSLKGAQLEQAYWQLATLYERLDEHKSEFYLEELVAKAESKSVIVANSYFLLAGFCSNRQQHDSSVTYLKKSFSTIDALNDSALYAALPNKVLASLDGLDNKSKIQVLNNLAQWYFYKKPQLSEKLCFHALSLAEYIGDEALLADTHKTLGFIYKTIGKFSDALDFYQKANKVYSVLNDSLNIGFTYNLMGVIQDEKLDLDNALKSFILAEDFILPLHENDPDNRQYIIYLSILYTNIGLLYAFDLKEYDKAESYYQRVISFAEETSDTIRMNAALTNMGHLSLNRNDYEKALEYFTQAYVMAEKQRNLYFLSRITHNLGRLYDKMQDYTKSREYYRKALTVMEKQNNQFSMIRTYRLIGESYLSEEILDKAYDQFQLTMNLAKKANSTEELKYVYYDLSKVFSAIGKSDSALYYYKRFTEIDKELNDEESKKRLEELKIQYETEKSEAENKYLKEQARIDKRNNYLLLGFAIVLLISAMLLYYFLRMKSRLLSQEKKLKQTLITKQGVEKQRLEDSIFAEKEISRLQTEKLKHKNRELSTATLQVINKNNILSNIQGMLHKETDDLANCKKNICNIIKENLDSDRDWEQFKLHFEEVHTGFFDKLKIDYPTLTANELKLCAYLRINLSSKEIAQILHNTADTVNKSRYRLRKKLNLSNEEDLVEFIRKI